jgi:hypothetical protein
MKVEGELSFVLLAVALLVLPILCKVMPKTEFRLVTGTLLALWILRNWPALVSWGRWVVM